MKYAKIIGTGSYLPKHIVANVDLEKKLDTTDQWIFQRTGIRQRHIATPEETSATMATHAAREALVMANLQSVDMIIVATTTADAFFPSTACLVQAALNLPICPAFDIAAACAGFNYALAIAEQFIRSGQCQHILVIGSETMTRLVDWLDRNTCILFGDGAGAIILSASDTPGILTSKIYADGNLQDILYANSMRMPDPYIIKMKGSKVFREAVTKMREILIELLDSQEMRVEELDWFIPHQANIRIIRALAKQIHLSQERIVATIEKQANTSSASIPIALDQGIRDQRILPGQLLCLGSFGGGVTWGATLIRY